MKRAALTIEFEQEKLDAIRYFSEQKSADIQDELDAFLVKLYEKYVPEPTRKFIESKPTDPKPEKRKNAATTGSRAVEGV